MHSRNTQPILLYIWGSKLTFLQDLIMHPDWDPSRVTDRGNDLLLIRLSDPVETFIEDGAQKVLY